MIEKALPSFWQIHVFGISGRQPGDLPILIDRSKMLLQSVVGTRQLQMYLRLGWHQFLRDL